MKTFLITLVLAMLSTVLVPAFATTVGTPASTTALGLRIVISRYLAEGGDINSLTMEQIMRIVDVDAANSTAQGKFADRFEILAGRGPIDQQTKAKLIAYTANQIGEDRRDGPGRYVIWLSNGEVEYNWEAEGRIKSLLDGSHLDLVNKGVWRQPDTKAQSMFHVGATPKLPPKDNRVAEDEAGHRLPPIKPVVQPNAEPIPKAPLPDDAKVPPTVQSPVSKASIESKPTAPSNEPTSSTPWSLIVILIVSATGLLWLVLKRRAK